MTPTPDQPRPDAADDDGILLGHGFRKGEQVADDVGREWSIVWVQNDLAMVTNGWMTTWYGVGELRRMAGARETEANAARQGEGQGQ